MRLHHIKKLLNSKRNYFQNPKENLQNGRKSLPVIHRERVNIQIYKELQKLNTKRIIQLINGQMSRVFKSSSTNG
jgi:hypothetical protein